MFVVTLWVATDDLDGVAVQIVANDLQLSPDECVVKRPIEDPPNAESGVVTDTPGSQGSFLLHD